MERYVTACDGAVLVPSKTREHLLAHPEIDGILEELIGKVVLPTDGSFLKTVIDMGQIVGRSGAIETDPVGFEELTWFAQRVHRMKPSRVSLEEQGPEVSVVAFLAFPDKLPGTQQLTGDYVMVTAWLGGLAPMEPWDPNIARAPSESFEESLRWWSRCALIHDPSTMGKPFQSTWKKVLEG